MKGNKSKIPCGWCKQPLTHAQHKKHYPVCTQRKAELEPLERQSKRPRTLSPSRSINRQMDQRNLERAATHVPQDNTGTVPMKPLRDLYPLPPKNSQDVSY
ncbi:hypothetical protein BJV82DRAFT_189314 [Fennellomyces sp. T-0311]|nr:hypothetical protein BJV82DRAFT_189314 [Fennellomyces sp. T-0311]